MSNKKSGLPANPEQVGALVGWLKDFFRQFQLAWRLLLDSRIPVAIKVIPFGTFAYMISPIDLVPDAVLGFGQVDDIMVLLLGLKMFIDLCPPDIVAEHEAAIIGQSGVWTPPEETVIDVESQTLSEEEKH